MARIVYYVAASFDGFITDAWNTDVPGSAVPGPAVSGSAVPGPAVPGAGERGAGVPGAGERFPGFDAARVGALVMGAETYRSLYDGNPDAWEFGRTPAWIFTHHEFPGIPGADITFVRGDVEEFYPDIVHDAGTKDIGLLGGGNLAAQFMDSGLVDEMVLTLVPVALGSGRPMLPVMKTTVQAVLAGTRPHGQGLVELHYSFGR